MDFDATASDGYITERSATTGCIGPDSDYQPIVVNVPGFDFDTLLKKGVERELASYEGLFSLSPLSSPGCTPPPSPLHLPQPETAPIGIALTLSPPPSYEDTAGPSTTPQPPPRTLDGLSSKVKRKARSKETSKTSRREKRQRDKSANLGHHQAREAVRRKYVTDKHAVKTATNISTSKNVTSTGYVGLDDGFRTRKQYTLAEMVGPGSKFKFELKQWNGQTPMPILDSNRRFLGVFAGHPEDSNWPALQLQAAQALEKSRPMCYIPPKRRLHRRGPFVALQTGVDHGKGQTHPKNVKQPPINKTILDSLNNLEPFKRMAGFASSVLASWAPKLYAYYVKRMKRVLASDPRLKHAFPSCPFIATTYNFGPQTVCFKHIDFGNLPFGLCAVTALGSYDPTKGGHMILWECGLVVEFPPGSTALIPSGVISHSNTRISKHETRYSFTQYCAGALFRWAEHGCMKTVDFYASLSEEQAQKERRNDETRWSRGLSLLPVFAERPRPPVASSS